MTTQFFLMNLNKDSFQIDIEELKNLLKWILWKLKGDFYITLTKDKQHMK